MSHIEDRWKSARTGEPTARHGTGKRWRYRYTDVDGKERSGSFARKADAENFQVRTEAALLAGTWLDPAAGKIALGTYAEQWLGSRSMDVSSLPGVTSHIRGHIIPGLGGRRLDQLARSPSIISGWLSGLKGEPSHVGNIFSTLSSVLNAAVDDGLIGRNPCRARSVQPPALTRRKIVPWLATQVAATRAALPGRYRAMVDCGAGLGMRQGEIFGLEVGAVEFLRQQVHVRLQVRIVGGVLVLAPPKRGKERHVPLGSPVTERLAEHIRLYPPREVTLPWREPGGKPRTVLLVFTNQAGRAVNRNTFNTGLWRPARGKAGLPDTRDNGMHALRHYYASALLADGVDPRSLSEYLGHEDPGFSLRVYGHLMPSAAGRVMQAISKALLPIGPETAQDAAEEK